MVTLRHHYSPFSVFSSFCFAYMWISNSIKKASLHNCFEFLIKNVNQTLGRNCVDLRHSRALINRVKIHRSSSIRKLKNSFECLHATKELLFHSHERKVFATSVVMKTLKRFQRYTMLKAPEGISFHREILHASMPYSI